MARIEVARPERNTPGESLERGRGETRNQPKAFMSGNPIGSVARLGSFDLEGSAGCIKIMYGLPAVLAATDYVEQHGGSSSFASPGVVDVHLL